jgi:chromate reductase
MPRTPVGVIVGSNRRESINRRLALALTRLVEDRIAWRWIRIDDLPMYNQDLEPDRPETVRRFTAEVASVPALLFVTPEHNRSLPAVLKNAIDWGS